MARRSRDLAGLAALGALGYTFFGPGRDRKDGTKAPVSDATPVPVERILRDSTAAEPRLQETFMGLDDVSGPQAETGGMGRSNVRAADQAAMPPPVSGAQAAAAPVSAASTPARPAASSSIAAAYRDPSRKKDVLSAPHAGAGRSTGRGGATAKELADYAEQQRLDRLRASGGMRAKGGAIKAKAKPKKMASGGMSSASKRADGIATRGKTKCKMY